MKQTRHGKTNFRMMAPFIEGLSEDNSHRRYESAGYMPLVVEYLYYTDCKGFPVYSICHYGEQNGDAMRDPEVTFSVDFENGIVEPQTFQNDYMGIYQEIYRERNGSWQYLPRLRTELDEFLWQWLKTLDMQGFRKEVA